MPSDDTTTQTTTLGWQRERTSDELLSFLDYRTDMLGELDDDDFELAAL